MSAEWVRLTVTRARPNDPDADTSVIGKRTVQADLDRIRAAADRAHRLATHVTAHRLETKERIALTDEDVEQLLEDVSQICARWSLPLLAVHVDTDIGHFRVGSRMAEALQLYDRDAFTEALREYLEARDLREPFPTRTELMKRIRVRYEFNRE